MKIIRLFNRTILTPVLTFTHKPHNLNKIIKYGTIVTGFTLLYKLQETINKPLVCIEDANTYAAKRQFDSAINEMRKAYGQLTVYPEIKITTHGNTYLIEFEVDQRKCDGIDIMSAFLETFKSSSDFKINGGGSVKESDVMTFNLEFVEKEQKFKTQLKGSITITMIKDGDRPSSRFIFEKTESLSNEDIKGVIRAYK